MVCNSENVGLHLSDSANFDQMQLLKYWIAFITLQKSLSRNGTPDFSVKKCTKGAKTGVLARGAIASVGDEFDYLLDRAHFLGQRMNIRWFEPGVDWFGHEWCQTRERATLMSDIKLVTPVTRPSSISRSSTDTSIYSLHSHLLLVLYHLSTSTLLRCLWGQSGGGLMALQWNRIILFISPLKVQLELSDGIPPSSLLLASIMHGICDRFIFVSYNC
ncbi:hypothetical protein J6590_031835 [Homalodisca vitripennis]|nr:hypothetical protein J6590_031835 [Homalodisca vitripennis]